MKPDTPILSILVLTALLCAGVARAGEPVFALVPKSAASEFFEASHRGCLAAAKRLAVRCLYRGPAETDFRMQDQVIDALVDEGVDGLAVSVVRSDYLAAHSIARARARGIPVVTFDSDFSPQERAADPGLRQAYIGTDNFALGRTLGQQLKRLKPAGGRLCILSGHPGSPNLQERVRGLRAALKGNTDALDQPLAGERGWREHPRCPLYNDDKRDLGLNQLVFMLTLASERPGDLDAIVSTGFWPQMDPRYPEAVSAFKPLLTSQRVVLLVTDTFDRQLRYLRQGLAHGNVGQDPYRMGYQAMQSLWEIVQGVPYAPSVSTPVTDCTPATVDRCTAPAADR